MAVLVYIGYHVHIDFSDLQCTVPELY